MDLGWGIKRRYQAVVQYPVRERLFRPFVFVHVPRTGGTSGARALGIEKGHRSALRGRTLMGRRAWERKFTFAFVRNPWERALSLYSFRVRKGRVPLRDGAPLPFDEYLNHTYPPEGMPRIATLNNGDQCGWIADESGAVIVDFVGRFERLAEGWARVSEVLNRDLALPHVNAAEHGPYTESYNDETRALVAREFARDIDMFGYRFGD